MMFQKKLIFQSKQTYVTRKYTLEDTTAKVFPVSLLTTEEEYIRKNRKEIERLVQYTNQ